MNQDVISPAIYYDLLDRLVKENLWSRLYTKRVMLEYERFLWLASRYEVAPSFEIDQVWHAHMLYSRLYERACNELGQIFIHHDPKMKINKSAGPQKDNYLETLSLYKKHFGDPPLDIWTNFKKSHHAYIDLYEYWVILAGDYRKLVILLFQHLKHKLCSLDFLKQKKKSK